ncbi:MAG: Rid family detoxifying hydrolase [Gammaproteobacteria bacterium]|nr:Rid family detoxifying hydrolase [Gammaproteobacteria bacterium]MDH5305149.1 Rid family detoxifying hydrolase [Gammaproteobacteria bacterium]MDH5323089.1 Rid family detoxifying hydrolase [Gammaproteobacteria bacterium]
MKRMLILLCALPMLGCERAAPELQVEWLNPPGTDTSTRPYSTAVRVDNMLYLSGALGTVPGTSALAEGGIQAETRQTLENISASLKMFGSSMENVVKCTVFLADIAEWAAMNEVYMTYFPNKPARSAVGNSGLGLDARVEIECMAAIR